MASTDRQWTPQTRAGARLQAQDTAWEYAKLQVTEPKVRTDMGFAEQPADDLFPCLCHRTWDTVKVPFRTKCLDAASCFPASDKDVHTAVILTQTSGVSGTGIGLRGFPVSPLHMQRTI